VRRRRHCRQHLDAAAEAQRNHLGAERRRPALSTSSASRRWTSS
jgi:hypothetical protein